MKFLYCLLLSAVCSAPLLAREWQLFKDVYPISDNPNVLWKSRMVRSETILFEANPIVRYSFYNNVYEHFMGQQAGYKKDAIAAYISVRPQLRMYTDSSVPVKMPSYRILLGTQYMRKIRSKNLLAFSLESGHFSNGQNGSTFSRDFVDGSRQSDSVLASITPRSDLSAMLNRQNGEFSTNLTELIVNYRINELGADDKPTQTFSFKAGATYYHNLFLFCLPFGGFQRPLIDIYGRWRLIGSIEFARNFDNGQRLSLCESIEYIQGAHPSVNPFRMETTLSFFLRNNFGMFGTVIAGHDNYNIRFVDSGVQFGAGLCWNLFPNIKLGAAE